MAKKKAGIQPDKVTLKRLEKLHPLLRREGKQIYQDILNKGVGVRFTQVLRTFAEQQALYDQGRRTSGRIVTKAGPGQSYHNYGMAIDFCLLKDTDGDGRKEVYWNRGLDLDKDGVKDWDEVVSVFKSYGWTWGGDWRWKDYPHFQKNFGYNWRDLLNLRNAGNVDSEGYVIIREDEEYS
jgi:peptidoglycan L-alanyl-D-glutamate endopeptidase CwlK